MAEQAEEERFLEDKISLNEQRLGTVVSVLKEGGARTVVDLGCGAGLDLCLYAQAVGPQGKAYGLDLSEAMIAKARRNMEAMPVENVEFLCGPADAIPLPDASMDLVLCASVLEHVDAPLEVVRELARGELAAGRHEVVWDGRNGNGETVASGGYVVYVEAEGNGTTMHVMRRKIGVVW